MNHHEPLKLLCLAPESARAKMFAHSIGDGQSGVVIFPHPNLRIQSRVTERLETEECTAALDLVSITAQPGRSINRAHFAAWNQKN